MAVGWKCLGVRQLVIYLVVAGIYLPVNYCNIAISSVYQRQSTRSTKLDVINNFLLERAHLVSNMRTPLVAICVPTRSVSDWKNLGNASLQHLLVPSILRTVTPTELGEYRVHLYLGINHDDSFWIKHVGQLKTSDWLVVHVGFHNMTKNRIPHNEVTRAAYDDGAEYIVRIHDDTEFVTNAWITAGVQTLSGYVPPNVGVVGPTCNEGNTAIMTHDMVHRTHCDIFHHYYPPVFDNWFMDDWITHVYEPGRSTKLTNWRVKHHLHYTRYEFNVSMKTFLDGELTKGREQILNFLKLKF